MSKALVNLCDICEAEKRSEMVAVHTCIICGKTLCYEHSRNVKIGLDIYAEEATKISPLLTFCPRCRDEISNRKRDIEPFFQCKNDVEKVVVRLLRVFLGVGEPVEEQGNE